MFDSVQALCEEARRAYDHNPGRDLFGLLDESVIDQLGFTKLEARVLVALLLAEGRVLEAQALLGNAVNSRMFFGTLQGFIERGLVTDTAESPVNLEPLVQQLKVQTPEELEVEEVQGEPPPVRIVNRPLRERVLLLARSDASATRGLAKVYGFIFGGTYTKRTFGMLGLLAKELGRDKAALFLLEHAHGQYRDPLAELLPMARARARGFRPADVPSEEEVNQGLAAVHRVAWEKRMRRWQSLNTTAAELNETEAEQYRKDMVLWNKLGRPTLS